MAACSPLLPWYVVVAGKHVHHLHCTTYTTAERSTWLHALMHGVDGTYG